MKFLLALLPLPLLGQTDLKPEPASIVSFPTEEGSFYQVEARKGESWHAVGEPLKGTGGKVTRTLPVAPDGKFRLTQLREQWVPVWKDEFNGTEIDRSKWANVEDGYGGGNNELQFYSTSPKYSFLKEGNLNICVYRDAHTTTDGKTQPYSSARLRSMYRGEWTYARIEIRAKLPSGEGIWPAIWMLPTNSPYGGWAAGGEIDIVESRGSEVDRTIGTLHFGDQWPKNAYKGGNTRFTGKNAAEDFHVYAIEWKRDEISWFLDGKKWQTLKKEEWFSAAAKKSDTAPFDQPFHLIFNLAVGGHFFADTKQDPKNEPDSNFPQTMLIDYVRVSQWAK
jgi:beta-glucanase (GH16 family)